MAKPRVFISSTFYDLRYMRESLKNFMQTMGYESVLFEEGDVFYKHGEAIEKSAYGEVKRSDIVVLIIGGKFGTEAKTKEGSTSKFSSITAKEFKAAVTTNIPLIVFIESNVNSEYFTYTKNIGKEVSYFHVNDIRVFEFIDGIKNEFPGVIIHPFEKSNQIIEFLRKQFAGYVADYLKCLREDEDAKKIQSTFDELNTVSKSILEMVNLLGSAVEDKDSYAMLLTNQLQEKLEIYANRLAEKIVIETECREIFRLEEAIRYYVITPMINDDFRKYMSLDRDLDNSEKKERNKLFVKLDLHKEGSRGYHRSRIQKILDDDESMIVFNRRELAAMFDEIVNQLNRYNRDQFEENIDYLTRQTAYVIFDRLSEFDLYEALKEFDEEENDDLLIE